MRNDVRIDSYTSVDVARHVLRQPVHNLPSARHFCNYSLRLLHVSALGVITYKRFVHLVLRSNGDDAFVASKLESNAAPTLDILERLSTSTNHASSVVIDAHEGFEIIIDIIHACVDGLGSLVRRRIGERRSFVRRRRRRRLRGAFVFTLASFAIALAPIVCVDYFRRAWCVILVVTSVVERGKASDERSFKAVGGEPAVGAPRAKLRDGAFREIRRRRW
mmetsp:Transcript_4812/g.17501  ORF Transcript_4812/g.17501 Transcript_4812/m.17501 type:complete len:220 (-) Transcript_4812:102-761(-)